MAREFSDSCDKWNIPNEVWFPKDFLSGFYKDFLSFNSPSMKALLDEWQIEFAKANAYP